MSGTKEVTFITPYFRQYEVYAAYPKLI